MNVDANNVEQVDAKLKALKGKYYERQLYESSISYSATPEGTPNLYADITYKIYLQNKSNTLTAKIKELTLNYDEDLKIISYGYEGSNVNTEVSESAITATKNGAGAVQLKEATIDLEKLEDRKISAGKREVLEVTFRTDANTIAKILNNPTGIKFDFMAEVKTYSTYSNNEENAFNRAEGIYAYFYHNLFVIDGLHFLYMISYLNLHFHLHLLQFLLILHCYLSEFLMILY